MLGYRLFLVLLLMFFWMIIIPKFLFGESYVGSIGNILIINYQKKNLFLKKGDKFPGTNENILNFNKKTYT